MSSELAKLPRCGRVADSEGTNPQTLPFRTKTCVVCGKALTVHEGVRGDACSQASCQWMALRQKLQAASERRERTLDQVRRLQRDLLVTISNSAPDEAPVVLLPANERPLGNLPERRRRRFRDYYMQSLSKAAARRFSRAARDAGDGYEEGDSHLLLAENPDTLALLGKACATCRGNCCEQGGEHAFQRPEVIRRYMQVHPELRPRDLLAAYLSRLPRVSYQGSCVFHCRDGCNLPRAMRSRTCNEYLCDRLSEINRIACDSGPARVFAAGPGGGHSLRRRQRSCGQEDADRVDEGASSADRRR